MRGFPDSPLDTAQNHVEWSAVEEGFRLLERDLRKLQVHIQDHLGPRLQVFSSNLSRSMPPDFARSLRNTISDRFQPQRNSI